MSKNLPFIRHCEVRTLVFLAALWLGGCMKLNKDAASDRQTSPDGVGTSNFDGESGTNPSGPKRLVAGPMYGRQLLASYLNVTGTKIDANVKATFLEAKEQLPQAGLSAEMTTSSVVSTMNLAARVCLNFVNAEKALGVAQRRAFNAFDFTKDQTPLLSTEAPVRDAANKLSLLFMSRGLTTGELKDVIKARNEVLSGVANSTTAVSNLALILCTSIASSLDAIEM